MSQSAKAIKELLIAVKTICKFASTDETRPHLMYCYHDDASQALVATDGHKAIFNREMYIEACDAFKANTYLKTGDRVKPDWEGFKYPNIKSFYPDLTKYTDYITWAVPEWVSKVPDKKTNILYLTMLGDVMLTTPTHTDQVIALDIKQLKPLDGMSIKFAFKKIEDKDGKLIGIDKNSPIYFLINKDFDGVIMPVRI